jgi:hypothetical protein
MESGGLLPLELLAEKSDRDFPNLFEARARTTSGLTEAKVRLRGLDHDPEASIVLMGSWGRAEVTAGSDDDFMVLFHGSGDQEVHPSVGEVAGVLDSTPGTQDIFGVPVFSEKLVHDIGLGADDNSNLTRRMLFLLESVPVTGVSAYRMVRDEILDRYLDKSVKAYRPPRFLLNDIVRYWRTICVDFAKSTKDRESGASEMRSCVRRERSFSRAACCRLSNASGATLRRCAATWRPSSRLSRRTGSHSASWSMKPSNQAHAPSGPTTNSSS